MILTLLALSATLEPERWVHVGGSAGAYEEYVDRQSIARSGDKAVVWTRRDFARGQGTAWNEIEFDCAGRSETILAWIRDDGKGVSHNTARPFRGPIPVQPGSAQERIFNMACS